MFTNFDPAGHVTGEVRRCCVYIGSWYTNILTFV